MSNNSKNNIDNSPQFDESGFDPSSIIDGGEEVVHIDTEALDAESETYAEDLVRSLTESYFDDGFMADNPNLRKRVKAELESLRILIRMRKSDEQVHDIALKAIGGNSGNASLYRALNETQKTLISIQTKIDETVDRVTALLKNYQTEINFGEDDNETDGDDEQEENYNSGGSSTHRGSKDFIEQMKREAED